MSIRTRTLGAAVALALSTLLAACDGSNPSGPGGTGRLVVRMTDAPTAGATEINVHITGLTVKRAGAPVERISGDVGTIDLLTLLDTSMLLTAANVPAGEYEFIQVELSEEGSSVVEAGTGDTFPLVIASDEVKVLGGFTVADNGTTTVLLDFDAAASLRHLGNGEWLLTPVISLANAGSA